MTTSFWQETHRRRTAPYDVVVVGGGIIGCSTAYWLGRQRSALDVALVEARAVGAGASGRNAGFVLQGVHTDFRRTIEQYGERAARRLWHFTKDNRDLLATELRGSAFDWRSDGSLTVARTTDQDERLQNCVPALRTAGAPVVHLDSNQTNTRLHSEHYQGSLLHTSGATVNPLRLVRHLAVQSGAEVFTQHPVEGLSPTGGGVTVETRPRRLEAGQVVLAVGPSLPALVPALSDYVRPVRAQMLATVPAEEQHIPVPVYSHGGEFYVRQTEDGTVLAGGGRHPYREAEATDVDDTTPAVQARIEKYLHRHFPWTQSLAIRRRWSGIMGFSPDDRPVIGPVPDCPGSVFATGFTGHGMAYGFRMGRLLAELVDGASRPDGLGLFAASRFDE